MNKGFKKWQAIAESVKYHFEELNEDSCDNCRYSYDNNPSEHEHSRCEECFFNSNWEKD